LAARPSRPRSHWRHWTPDTLQVTHLTGAAIFPDYSPDGSEIVFAAQPAGATARNIYVVPSDGGTPQQLTTVGNNVYPAFSPGGSKMSSPAAAPAPHRST
jgi:Tol biopolymer transport system component